jgi:hypothetical protein
MPAAVTIRLVRLGSLLGGHRGGVGGRLLCGRAGAQCTDGHGSVRSRRLRGRPLPSRERSDVARHVYRRLLAAARRRACRPSTGRGCSCAESGRGSPTRGQMAPDDGVRPKTWKVLTFSEGPECCPLLAGQGDESYADAAVHADECGGGGVGRIEVAGTCRWAWRTSKSNRWRRPCRVPRFPSRMSRKPTASAALATRVASRCRTERLDHRCVRYPARRPADRGQPARLHSARAPSRRDSARDPGVAAQPRRGPDSLFGPATACRIPPWCCARWPRIVRTRTRVTKRYAMPSGRYWQAVPRRSPRRCRFHLRRLGTWLPPPRDPRKERPVRRRRIRRALRAMVLLAAAVCTYVIFGSHAPARSRVAAPSLIGETMTEARSSAQGAGLRVQPIRHRMCPHPGTPVGRVCEQTPSPGSQVPRHAILRITLSPGTPHRRRSLPCATRTVSSAVNSPLGHSL